MNGNNFKMKTKEGRKRRKGQRTPNGVPLYEVLYYMKSSTTSESASKEKRRTFVSPHQQCFALPRIPPVCFAYLPWKDLLILLPVTNTETMCE